MASGFPKLPGFVPTYELKPHYKKVSHTKQQQNRDINNIQPKSYPLPRELPQKELDQTRMLNPNYISTTHDHFKPKNVPTDITQIYQPDWVRLDRHVLRFYGYFKQSVVQSNLENYRCRKVKILFYLEDNSISINQQKQQNSGIPQGILLKRQKCLKNGKFFVPQDFKVGANVQIYGKNIRIYNCDIYTREFYQKLGIPQGPSEEYNQDIWQQKTNNKWIPVKDAVMKEYLQKKLGGGKVVSTKQFLQNDRKVLKFYAVSDCDYIFHYFLADDTIQVRQVNLPNSGKDPFPVAFRRQKLPFKYAINQPGQTYAQDFLTADKLELGKNIEVFGKIYKLVDCDSFTRSYYANKYNRVFPNVTKQIQEFQKKSNIIIPPHNGIGSEQDSLGYIYRLVPQPPKKDFFKWIDHQICLRFTALFNTDKPEDKNRQFVITYFLNDDSLQIYEPPVRNSGINEGKFLQRNKYQKQNNKNEFISPEDLIVGGDIKINGYTFHLTDCDLFTKKWFAQNTILK